MPKIEHVALSLIALLCLVLLIAFASNARTASVKYHPQVSEFDKALDHCISSQVPYRDLHKCMSRYETNKWWGK